MVFLDTETRSAIPIKTAGAIRYAEDHECLSLHWLHDDEYGVRRAEARMNDLLAIHFFPSPFDLVAHNATFDRHVVSRLPNSAALRNPSHWTCTAAMCRYFGWPASLAEAGKRAGLPAYLRKLDDSGGIQTFCIPPYVEPDEDPERWEQFMEYGDRDVETCRDLFYALREQMPERAWTYWHETERKVWELDQLINDQGFKVDMQAVETAQALVPGLKSALDACMLYLTDGEVGSVQSPKLLPYLRSEFLLQVENLRKETVAELLADELPERARALLELRRDGAKNSVAKYQRMVDMVSDDGRVRGGYLYHGPHTGRWAGQGIQPQNLTRPLDDLDPAEVAESMARSGGSLRKLISQFPAYERKPLDLFVSGIRGSIIAEPGRTLLIADYNQIEARIGAWYAGCARKLQAFVDHDEGRSELDPYEVTARDVLGDASRRQEGKTLDLGLQFGMGWAKHAAMTGLDEETAKAQVYGWRDTYQEIPNTWRELQAALDRLARGLCSEDRVGCVQLQRHGEMAIAWLPNGKPLFYHGLRGLTWGQEMRRAKDKGWLEKKWDYFYQHFGRPYDHRQDSELPSNTVLYRTSRGYELALHGGITFENFVQAIAREVLVYHMLKLYQQYALIPVLHSHDELAYEIAVQEADSLPSTVQGVLETSPPWAPDLPLKAELKLSRRYTK